MNVPNTFKNVSSATCIEHSTNKTSQYWAYPKHDYAGAHQFCRWTKLGPNIYEEHQWLQCNIMGTAHFVQCTCQHRSGTRIDDRKDKMHVKLSHSCTRHTDVDPCPGHHYVVSLDIQQGVVEAAGESPSQYQVARSFQLQRSWAPTSQRPLHVATATGLPIGLHMNCFHSVLHHLQSRGYLHRCA